MNATALILTNTPTILFLLEFCRISWRWRFDLNMALSARPALHTKAGEALETILVKGTEVDAALPLFLPISLVLSMRAILDMGSYLAGAVDEVLVADTYSKVWHLG